ncbi:shikimate kinase [Oceanospirillum multiglobuliferum]|uniref:Shikimate kinase n=1 Tax=Oceanospirillum multiglobuliferum TaxID=64969 RepID=A0A1T4S3I8_9GAMM|nr:shikimate kinase AroK [Oceanospirillum multiglobuliferum]OPX54499.1 shikimate kinase I [Oceanospirillum multiglobuliferum]SKA22666.1 shikimate kinase [Oceanospirillum multiglobuliferum]
MHYNHTIVLVGPMGAGKSTIGRLLATELGLNFFDSDREIEARCGANIPWIFDKEGEEGFRKRETQTIAELLEAPDNIVMATGGGAILKPENRDIIGKYSTVIYLHTTVAQQLQRTAKDKNRPLLQTENPEAVLKALFEVRDPLYREAADIIVNTDRQSPKSVVRTIMKKLNSL